MDQEGGPTTITCPTCGEPYDSHEKVTKLLMNVAHCVNLTCLEDLSSEPIEEALLRYQPRRRAYKSA